MAVGQYLIRWLADYAKPNVAPRTYERYEIIVRNHLIPRLGSIPLKDLSPAHIVKAQTYWRESGRVVGKGGLSPRSCLHNHRVLRQSLDHAVKWRLLAVNPVDSVDAPKVPRAEVEALDERKVKELLSTVDGHELGNLIHVAIFTGMRRGELLGLRWADLDFGAGTLHVQQTVYRLAGHGFLFGQPKTSRGRRTIALAPSVVAAMR